MPGSTPSTSLTQPRRKQSASELRRKNLPAPPKSFEKFWRRALTASHLAIAPACSSQRVSFPKKFHELGNGYEPTMKTDYKVGDLGDNLFEHCDSKLTHPSSFPICWGQSIARAICCSAPTAPTSSPPSATESQSSISSTISHIPSHSHTERILRG